MQSRRGERQLKRIVKEILPLRQRKNIRGGHANLRCNRIQHSSNISDSLSNAVDQLDSVYSISTESKLNLDSKSSHHIPNNNQGNITIDQPNSIVSVFRYKEKLVFVLDWKERSDGNIPDISLVNQEDIIEHHPEIFLQLKTRLENLFD